MRPALSPTVKKLYYSIGEVSETTSLKPYVLRYWETEFPDLSPAKNRAGNRIYTEKDINTILDIKRLLYQEKFTIEGARKHFRDNRLDSRPTASTSRDGVIREKEMARKALRDVQESLTELVELIRRQK